MTAAVSHCPLVHNLRDGRPEDLPLIIRTWVSAMRGSPSVWGVPTAIYSEGQRTLVLRELGRSCALVAVDPADDAHVFGYVVYRIPNVMHFVFVKEHYRKVGLGLSLVHAAQRMLEPGGFSFTQSGTVKLKEKLPLLAELGAVYNPFLLYG